MFACPQQHFGHICEPHLSEMLAQGAREREAGRESGKGAVTAVAQEREREREREREAKRLPGCPTNLSRLILSPPSLSPTIIRQTFFMLTGYKCMYSVVYFWSRKCVKRTILFVTREIQICSPKIYTPE